MDLVVALYGRGVAVGVAAQGFVVGRAEDRVARALAVYLVEARGAEERILLLVPSQSPPTQLMVAASATPAVSAMSNAPATMIVTVRLMLVLLPRGLVRSLEANSYSGFQ